MGRALWERQEWREEGSGQIRAGKKGGNKTMLGGRCSLVNSSNWTPFPPRVLLLFFVPNMLAVVFSYG